MVLGWCGVARAMAGIVGVVYSQTEYFVKDGKFFALFTKCQFFKSKIRNIALRLFYNFLLKVHIYFILT